MTVENPLARRSERAGSPTNPQECCDWANERMITELRTMGYQWMPSGNPARPIELRKFV